MPPPQQQNPYANRNPYANQQPSPYAGQQPTPYAQQGIPPQDQQDQQGQWAHPQSSAPNPQAGPAGCRFCGAMPAERVTFRAHQGLLILMRFQKLDGPMCATCGEAVYREMSGKTLWQGWWSPFSLFLLAPFTLLWNLFTRRKVKALQPPAPGQHGPQLPAGVPLHKRPLSYVALIPLGWIGFFVISVVLLGDPLT